MGDPIVSLRKRVGVPDLLWVMLNFLQVLPRDQYPECIDKISAAISELKDKYEQE